MFWRAALAVVLLAVAQTASAQGAGALRTVTDMSGRVVPLPAQVRRIGCLEVLCYEKLFLLGASDRIAMMVQTNAPWMETTNPAMRRIQKIGSEPNVEELLREKVDVVFRTFGYPAPAKIDLLARMGIPIVVSQTMSATKIDSIDAFVESRKRMLRLFAAVLGPE